MHFTTNRVQSPQHKTSIHSNNGLRTAGSADAVGTADYYIASLFDKPKHVHVCKGGVF